MDEIDRKILDLMGVDARTTYASLAIATNISDVAVKKRVDKLVNEGIIRRFTIGVDPEKTGAALRAAITFDVEPRHLESVIKSLKASPEFYSIWKTTGAHNIHCRGAFRDLHHINQVLETSLSTQGIHNFETSFLISQEKDRTYVYAKKRKEK